MEITKRTIMPSKGICIKDKPIKRVAAYCRVSTEMDMQEESYESQVSYYEKKIKSEPNSELVGIYGDKGISGTSAVDRPEFKRLIEDCENDKIDFVYCKSISRFARNAADCMKYVDILSGHNVVIYFEKENIRSDDKSLKVVLKFLATLAQEESNSISQAVKWSYIQNAKLGRPTCPTCYGYRKTQVGTNKHAWVIDLDEARRIRLIFSRASAGKETREIAAELNQFEANAATDVVWSAQRVRNAIRNIAYMGSLLVGKTTRVDYVSKKAVKNDGTISEQILLEKHHEPIVSEWVWKRANAMLMTNKRRKKSDGRIDCRKIQIG